MDSENRAARIAAAEEARPRCIAVFGIRYDPSHEEFNDAAPIEGILLYLHAKYDGKVRFVTGGSRGVEMIVEQWCHRESVAHERIKPVKGILDPFGHRNEQIIRNTDESVAFWDGVDIDVARAIRLSVSHGRSVVIYPTE